MLRPLRSQGSGWHQQNGHNDERERHSPCACSIPNHVNPTMDSNQAVDIIENESTIVRIEQQRRNNHNFTHADFNPPAEGPSILATFDRAVAAQHLDVT